MRCSALVVAVSLLASGSGCTESPKPVVVEKKSTETKRPDTKSPETKTTPDVAPTTAVPPPKPEVPEPRPGSRTWTFDDATVGAVAHGFTIKQTGETVVPPATWEVVTDDDAPSGANVFGVTKSVGVNKTFNLAFADATAYRDFELTVMLKALAGTNNQGGGVVFRAKGERDHYVARWNPVESNFRIYALLGGARVDLASAPLELEGAAWHVLKVVVAGDRIECFIDDKPIAQATDKALPDAGMIGLWTKGDATTLFDDLAVEQK